MPVPIEDLLADVAKPSRYTGGEWNSITKDPAAAAVHVVLAYPDVYDLGMSNMGLGILYDLLNREADVAAERVFAPWLDMQEAMRRDGVPLWTLETRTPVKEADLLGFSLQYEMTFTNVLDMLDLAGIPVASEDRGDDSPIVIAGGSGAFNPEPMARFIDAFVIGEGEDVIMELAARVRRWKSAGLPRRQRLEDLLDLPGVYVAAFYRPGDGPDGRPRPVVPAHPDAPAVVRRRIVETLPPPLTRPVVPFLQTVHDRAAIEIQRGCTQGCRFCQAGMIYRPARERSPEEVLAAARELLRSTGYDELSLLSLSTTDHSRIVPMVDALTGEFPDLKLSLPSTRVDSFSVDVANAVSRGKKHTLTLAPEAGTQRLRYVINKLVSDDDLLSAAENAFSRGWTGIKMYFMVGLPTETDEDVQGIVELGRKVKEIGRAHAGGRAKVRVSTSNLVPKPHTPFQWASQLPAEVLSARHEILRRGCRAAGLEFSWNSPESSFLEAALSRGGREMGDVILAAWRAGAKFDAWGEQFEFARWEGAFAASGVDWRSLSQREYDTQEPLPWDHIDCGVTRAYLRGQWLATTTGRVVDDCHHGSCNVCGMQSFGLAGVADCVIKLEALKAQRHSVERDEERLEIVTPGAGTEPT
ncbi:MAG: TIGR03960 family B12-binding radical SAM protein [Dehalococcoidia bacterium]